MVARFLACHEVGILEQKGKLWLQALKVKVNIKATVCLEEQIADGIGALDGLRAGVELL